MQETGSRRLSRGTSGGPKVASFRRRGGRDPSVEGALGVEGGGGGTSPNEASWFTGGGATRRRGMTGGVSDQDDRLGSGSTGWRRVSTPQRRGNSQLRGGRPHRGGTIARGHSWCERCLPQAPLEVGEPLAASRRHRGGSCNEPRAERTGGSVGAEAGVIPGESSGARGFVDEQGSCDNKSVAEIRERYLSALGRRRFGEVERGRVAPEGGSSP